MVSLKRINSLVPKLLINISADVMGLVLSAEMINVLAIRLGNLTLFTNGFILSELGMGFSLVAAALCQAVAGFPSVTKTVCIKISGPITWRLNQVSVGALSCR